MPESNNWIRHEINGIGSDDVQYLLNAIKNLSISGIEERSDRLIVYYTEEFITSEIKTLCILLSLNPEHLIKHENTKNWNAIWESSFEPVHVDTFCIVYAHFHKVDTTKYAYHIKITPQMSFGTGHHETTQLMMRQMKNLDFKNKSVLDYGTGTGILAILSSMLGADKIIGIDNLPWAVENAIENAIENAKQNQCSSIEFIQANNAYIDQSKFDFILVNIVRRVIYDNLDIIANQVVMGGYLLLSGYLINDAQKMIYQANRRGFELLVEEKANNWICQLYQKLDNA